MEEEVGEGGREDIGDSCCLSKEEEEREGGWGSERIGVGKWNGEEDGMNKAAVCACSCAEE